MNFKYTTDDLNFLRNCDEKMCKLIDEVGFIEREINPDCFSALIRNVISQQISVKAAETVLSRLYERAVEITPKTLINLDREEIKQCGVSYKKADYILNIANATANGDIKISEYQNMSDKEIIDDLIKINGVGKWTAEMILIFSLNRMNILSYNDFALKKGLAKLYDLEQIDKKIFSHYEKLFSPYCSIASLYLWKYSAM